MSTILPNMVIELPVPGADRGTWDDKINAGFSTVDAHDHTSGKGVAIASAALDINADVSWHGYTITSLGKISFTAITAPVSGSKNLFVNTSDNELYWRTNSGTNVKLTNGTSINTTLVGGIVGDYSSVGAAVAFDDSNKRYTFKTQTGTWARMASGPVRIFEYNTTESVYVEHAVDAALAAPYTVTWPAALPGATGFVMIDAAGAVSFTSSPTTTGTITASDYKLSSDRVRVLGAPAFQQIGSTHVFNGNYWALGNSSTATLYATLPLDVGDRIKSVRVYIDKNSDATNTITAELFRCDSPSSGGVATSLGTGTESGNATGAIGIVAATGLTEVVSAGKAYNVAVYQSDATPSSSDFVFTVEVTYDRP